MGRKEHSKKKTGPPVDLPWTPANAWLREPITEENRKKLRKIESLQQDENINKKNE